MFHLISLFPEEASPTIVAAHSPRDINGAIKVTGLFVPTVRERPADCGLPLIWGALLILSAGIFFAQILEFFETGHWSYMSMMEFIDLLTEDTDLPEGPMRPLLIRSILAVIPALPVFVGAATMTRVFVTNG